MRTGAVVVLLALSTWISGCTSVVDGTAVRGQAASTHDLPLLDEGDLDVALLSVDELNEALGSSQIEVTDEIDEMTDDSADISDPDCLGAFYTAEEPVYQGTGYTALLTRLASEPGDDYEHWVEETAVIVPSLEAAEKFVDESAQAWDACASTTVSISDGEDWYDWELEEVVRGDGIVSQLSATHDFMDWQCQHAMAAASNAVIEASVCGERIRDEATMLVTEMIAKVAKR
jgi:hypothetical protein